MASATHVLNDTLGEDFKKAEKLTVPVTLLSLLFAFGAFVAAGLPVLLAFSAVLASIGLYSLSTSLLPGDFETTQSVILLIGMAVGSTTRCSTCGVSVRSATPDARLPRRCSGRPQRRGWRCSSRERRC
jgi:MMPL family